jgi:hypothetical protein
MKGADVNPTESNTSSDVSRTRSRLMAVMLPALLMVYVAVPLAAARK